MDIAKSPKILLGICGGIAAYKAASLLRILQKQGFEVQVVATASSFEFVGKATWEGLSGLPVLCDTFEPGAAMEHIYAPDNADAFVIAPCTANHLANFASGAAPDLLSTMYLAATCPVIIAPAMNVNMWNHPATKRNVEILESDGVQLIEPGAGELACGWQGQGRLASQELIALFVARAISPQSLRGMTILVSGGATREMIDPVRFLSNPSSGKMAVAVARQAWLLGATVHLVAGESARLEADLLDELDSFGVEFVGNAAHMLQIMQNRSASADWIVGAAAVADYTVEPAAQKTKKSDGTWTVEFERTADIVRSLAESKPKNQKVIGFAAETQNVIGYARDKMTSKNLDAIVYNDVSNADIGFGADENEGGVIVAGGETVELEKQSKDDFAKNMLKFLLEKWGRSWA